METSSIKKKDIEALLESLGKLVKKRLKTDGIQMREREKEVVPCLRFNRPIEIQCLVLVLKGSDGLHSFAGNDSSDNRHQAKTALILSEHFDR
jgi:ubiquinone biosynthesis protein COQ9